MLREIFSVYSGFPLSLKTNISKFQFDQESGRRRTTMWMCYLQIVIYFIYLFIFHYYFNFTVVRTMSHKQSRGKHQDSLENKTNCFPLDLTLKYKNVFTLPVSFIGSYTDDEPDFPRRNNLILQEKGVWHRQGSEFQGLFNT